MNVKLGELKKMSKSSENQKKFPDRKIFRRSQNLFWRFKASKRRTESSEKISGHEIYILKNPTILV